MKGRPLPKPKQPRVALWVTERELSLIALKFAGFRGGLSEAIETAYQEARKARTAHNRALKEYRNSRREVQ